MSLGMFGPRCNLKDGCKDHSSKMDQLINENMIDDIK